MLGSIHFHLGINAQSFGFHHFSLSLGIGQLGFALGLEDLIWQSALGGNSLGFCINSLDLSFHSLDLRISTKLLSISLVLLDLTLELLILKLEILNLHLLHHLLHLDLLRIRLPSPQFLSQSRHSLEIRNLSKDHHRNGLIHVVSDCLQQESQILGFGIVFFSCGDIHFKVKIALDIFFLDFNILPVRHTDHFLVREEHSIHCNDLVSDLLHSFCKPTKYSHFALRSSIKHSADSRSDFRIVSITCQTS